MYVSHKLIDKNIENVNRRMYVVELETKLAKGAQDNSFRFETRKKGSVKN